MTQAAVHLFTLAEANQHVLARKLEPALRKSLETAISTVCDGGMLCILCNGPLKGTVAYVALLLVEGAALPEGILFLPQYGGVCIDCAVNVERSEVQRYVSHNAHLSFGEVAGSA